VEALTNPESRLFPHPSIWLKTWRALGLAVICVWLCASLEAEPLPLKRAVELALAHSTTSAIAAADETHAEEGYRELRNSYIPQATIGSGLGKSWGFPLSLEGAAPSIINLNASAPLYNAAFREGLHAARADVASAAASNRDKRNEVIQDVVVTYAELNKWEERTERLRGEKETANQFEEAVAERVKEGVDSGMDRTRARLESARVRLRLTEAEGSADVLREHLARLTGVDAASIETVKDSIPAFPAAPKDEDVRAKMGENPGVESAVEHARAQYLRAKAEHKSLWPTFDFATQYARLARYNNYDAYFKTFQPDNASLGVVIRWPILNYAERARQRAADADALKAAKEAEAAKNRVSEETLRLQRTVKQLEAAQDVAQLEYELSRANLDAVTTRMDTGQANMHDLDQVRAKLSEDASVMQDTTFELERARIALMRATGDLEAWVMSSK
jgi:outer membrane protein TolC